MVADPNYAPMYTQRMRRVKTDRRDARALAHSSKRGAYRAAHWTSDGRRELRTVLSMREALVRTRTAWISRIQLVLRRGGYRFRIGKAETFVARVEERAVPESLRGVIAPLLQLLHPLNEQTALLDDRLPPSRPPMPSRSASPRCRAWGP